MTLIQLLLLGAIQGITEWLPISSSGHVLLASEYFGLEGRDELLINAVSNLGTLIAMLVYFWRDIIRAIGGGFELLVSIFDRSGLSQNARLALYIILATPVALMAGVLYELVLPVAAQDALRSIWTVAATTIGFGILLWWADVRGSRDKSEKDMTAWEAVLIGATQAIAAILPGTSRSGITMTAARFLGYERTEAARFAMLIGAPILAAASAYGVLGLMTPEAGDTLSVVTLQDGLFVAAFSFITGILSIWGLMSLLKRMSFLPFVLYRFALGIALILATPMVGLIG